MRRVLFCGLLFVVCLFAVYCALLDVGVRCVVFVVYCHCCVVLCSVLCSLLIAACLFFAAYCVIVAACCVRFAVVNVLCPVGCFC